MKQIFDFFANETDYPDLASTGAVERLSRAIQCKTIDRGEETDSADVEKLHALIRESYPALMATASFEVIGRHSLLITIPGTDPTLRPCLFMSHQDVVPVVAGTEADWTHDAFSGTVADGYIWGRGTLDIKNQVFGVLEAADTCCPTAPPLPAPPIWPSATTRRHSTRAPAPSHPICRPRT